MAFNRDGDRGGRGGFSPRGRSSFGRGNDRGGFSRSGGRSFGGGRSFSRDDSGPREMFDAVCDNCGKACQVPFRPTSGKPVYCSDCFEKMGGRSERPERSDFRSERSERPRPDFNRPQSPRSEGNSAQLEAINTKLDRLISLLEPKKEVKEVVSEPAVVVEEVKIPKAKKVKKVKEEVTSEE